MAKDTRKPEPVKPPVTEPVAAAPIAAADLEAEFRAEVTRRYHAAESAAVVALRRADHKAHAKETAIANALAGVLNAWRQHG
jgi:hypothetical protein